MSLHQFMHTANSAAGEVIAHRLGVGLKMEG